MSNTSHANFSVSASYYTDMARHRVLDGEWREAVQILMEGFEGITYDIAYSILNGTHNIVTVDGNLSLVEQLDESYQEEVRDIYCDNKFYELNKLYEFVGFINQNDVHEHIQKMGFNYKIPEFHTYISKYMLKDEEKSFNVSCGKKLMAIKAVEVNANTMPLWLSKDFFSRSVKIFAEKLPKDVYIESGIIEAKDTPIVKETINTDITVPVIEKEKTLDISDRISMMQAEEIAKSYGFNNSKEFSEHWRELVLKAILERNCEWKEFTYISEDSVEQIKYPYDIAVAYALNRTNIRGFAPDWKPVCEQGLKMDGDSRIHSDLWLALGFDFDGLSYKHSTKENDILISLMSTVQGHFIPEAEFTVLNSSNLKKFSGKIVSHKNKNITKNDILLIPHAGPEYELQAMKAGMVISVIGGKLAHLVIVGREMGLPIIRLDNAMNKLKEGMVVNVDFDNCKLKVE